MHILNDFFAIIMMLFLIMTGSDNLSKQQIFTLVQDNHEYLQECVDAKDYEKAEEISGIKSVHSSSWSEDSYVEFYCGGAGIVPSSSYYGFYFSPGDVPLAVDVTQKKNSVRMGTDSPGRKNGSGLMGTIHIIPSVSWNAGITMNRIFDMRSVDMSFMPYSCCSCQPIKNGQNSCKIYRIYCHLLLKA